MSFEQKLAFAFGGGFFLLIYCLVRLAIRFRRGDFDSAPAKGDQTKEHNSIDPIDVAVGTGHYGGGAIHRDGED
jgi:hypothetical protein